MLPATRCRSTRMERFPMIRLWSLMGKITAGASIAALCACSSSSQGNPTPASESQVASTGLSTQAVEWVAFHTEVPFAETDFHSLAAGLIGADAEGGKFVSNKEISPGIYLSAVADPTT